MTAPSVRDAAPDDAAAVTGIYEEGIAGRMATFETAPPGIDETARRIQAVGPRHAFLVAELDGAVAGWAATTPYSPRAVYDGIAEYSVYVSASARGRGVGRALLVALLERAQSAGLHKVTGRIFPENTASLELCARTGFRVVGTHRAHGRLDGTWRDVVVVEALLEDPP